VNLGSTTDVRMLGCSEPQAGIGKQYRGISEDEDDGRGDHAGKGDDPGISMHVPKQRMKAV
jgi:hypothetical protein